MADTHSQTRALERYSQTAGAQLARSGTARLAGLTAAAGAGLALTGVADAAIVYSGVNVTVAVNQTSLPVGTSYVSSFDQFGIDFNGDAQAEFQASVFWSMSAGGASTSFNGQAQLVRPSGANNFASLVTAGGFGVNLKRLAAGDPINPAFGHNRWLTLFEKAITSSGGSFPDGVWLIGATGIAGVAFELSGATHYGWIRMSWDDLIGIDGVAGADGFPDRLTVHDMAWNDTPGAAIVAGEGVPVPAPLALLALGAVGIAATRRRRALPAAA